MPSCFINFKFFFMFMISLEVIHEKILDLNFLEKKKRKTKPF